MGPPILLRHASSYEHKTAGHPEGTGRLEAIEAELSRHDWLGWEQREAPAVDLDVLRAVHANRHIEAVQAVSERGGGAFDADTVASEGSYVAALHAAGGACAMVEALLGAEAPAGFCMLRPPGHHALPVRAMGFCLFNNIAVAARHALDALGARRVLILDWDVHHGNGTNDIFHASDEVLFASIHQSPLYPGTGPLEDSGSGAGEGFTINLPVPAGSGEEVWLSLVEHVVAPAAQAFGPDLVLVSAGFDAHLADPLAQCRLDTSSFAELARHARAIADAADAPVGAVLEGGYDPEALAASVAATLPALAEGGEPRSVERESITERAAEQIGRFWTLA
ncbi:MAG: histone deacetylase [Actinomycetota bacterium]|nr:histone deacetylase [Actinomycetota bacterium]